jgi:hypothetical protein
LTGAFTSANCQADLLNRHRGDLWQSVFVESIEVMKLKKDVALRDCPNPRLKRSQFGDNPLGHAPRAAPECGIVCAAQYWERRVAIGLRSVSLDEMPREVIERGAQVMRDLPCHDRQHVWWLAGKPELIRD